MEVMEAILTRHSTRSFTDKPVPKETLEEIASAGTYAASGRNRQPVLIVAVTNPELIAELSRINAEIMGTEGDPFYGVRRQCWWCWLISRCPRIFTTAAWLWAI